MSSRNSASSPTTKVIEKTPEPLVEDFKKSIEQSSKSSLEDLKKSSEQPEFDQKSNDPDCTMPKPCDTIKTIDNQIKMLSNDKKIFQHCCNLEKYWSIEEQPKTLMELMKKIIREKIDSCDKLFTKFPDSIE